MVRVRENKISALEETLLGDLFFQQELKIGHVKVIVPKQAA